MGRVKPGQRQILVNYCGEEECERILLMLVKLLLENRGGRMNSGNENEEIR